MPTTFVCHCPAADARRLPRRAGVVARQHSPIYYRSCAGTPASTARPVRYRSYNARLPSPPPALSWLFWRPALPVQFPTGIRLCGFLGHVRTTTYTIKHTLYNAAPPLFVPPLPAATYTPLPSPTLPSNAHALPILVGSVIHVLVPYGACHHCSSALPLCGVTVNSLPTYLRGLFCSGVSMTCYTLA